jgi:HPt (histidine-containing phosphotransfer) domain-containing protein
MTSNAQNTKDICLEELKQEYLEDLYEILKNMENLVTTLKNDDGSNDLFKELWREVHSLKGTAGSFGLKFVSMACHKWEDLMDVSDKSSKEDEVFFNKYLKIIEVLKEYRENPELRGSELSILDKRLKNIISDDNIINKRILILETSSMMKNVYKEILSNSKNQLSFVEDGYLGLGRLINEKFDVVISSNSLTSISGKELIDIMRTISNPNKLTRMILITSDSINDKEFLNCDFNWILKKDDLIKELPMLLR